MLIWVPTTNLIKSGKYTFTKDKVFAIEPNTTIGDPQTYSIKLYIKCEHIIDPNSALSRLISDGIIIKKGNTNIITKRGGLDIQECYDIYEFYKLLRDERELDADGYPIYTDKSLNEIDCLKFGECLTFASQSRDKSLFEELLKADENPPILQTGVTKIPFGATDKDEDNIKLLKKINKSQKNNFAVPTSGESYAIVRKNITDEYSQYHAAFVLYTHNGVNITLEVEAGTAQVYQPQFGFYDINPDGNTFHRRWSAELYKTSSDAQHQDRYNELYNDGETIVLKSRNMEDITRELEAEKMKLATANTVADDTVADDTVAVAPLAKKTRTGGKNKKSKSKPKSKSKKSKQNKTKKYR